MADNQFTIEEFGQTVKLQYPQYQGMSDREIGEATLTKYPDYQSRIKPDEGFVADIKGIGTGIKESAIKRADATGEIKQAQEAGEQGAIRSALQRFGQGAGFVSDIVGETVMGGLKALAPQPVQEAIAEGVGTVAEKVVESQPAQDLVEFYGTLDEVQQRDIDATLGTLGLVLDVAGGALIKAPAKKAIGEVTEAVGDVVRKADDILGTAGDTSKKTFAFIKEKVTPTGETVKEVDNLKASEALNQATENLSKAMEGGIRVDISDATRELNEITKGLSQTMQEGIKVDVDLSEATKMLNDATSDLSKAIKSGVETITDIPRRAQVNIQTAKATREAVENLPTETAKRAVRDGIDINDVRQVFKTVDPNTQQSFKQLHETVKKFEVDPSGTNPIEVVGKPIVKRLKDLDAERVRVGGELGAIADDLGTVTGAELTPTILGKLNEVSGLKGLKLADDGTLDFTDTTLATTLSKADQNAIKEIFAEAITDGTGKSKHLLRQELFEILNGKKSSLENITGTQEKAFQAVRQGLSDVLDTKNASYKATNQEYAKIVTPLGDMRKMMKNLDPDIDEDILDMSAGLLARRLTSNSITNPKIRLILRQLDDATAVKGKTTLKVEELQDFYNILERYYDIAGKTGFQAQITSGIEKAGGVTGAVAEKLRGLAGRSDAVRQKALEDLILEVYGQ